MGKKSRRKAKLRAAARMAQTASFQASPQARPESRSLAAEVTQPRAVVAPVQQTVLSSKASQFEYVGPELRLIAIIAGALFVLLFILAFILK